MGLAYLRVHLERVNHEVSRALTIAYRDFLGPAGNGRGFYIFLFCPRCPAVPL